MKKHIAYICDRKACGDACSPECNHTFDIEHAVNFERFPINVVGECENSFGYFEKDVTESEDSERPSDA